VDASAAGRQVKQGLHEKNCWLSNRPN
jgi:hypothetical protein